MSDSAITKETLEYLAGLARIDLDPQEEERLLGDLQRILAYVSELQSADTSGVTPMNGGTMQMNVFREDASRSNTNRGAGAEEFPDKQAGYLKVPAVFDRKTDTL